MICESKCLQKNSKIKRISKKGVMKGQKLNNKLKLALDFEETDKNAENTTKGSPMEITKEENSEPIQEEEEQQEFEIEQKTEISNEIPFNYCANETPQTFQNSCYFKFILSDLLQNQVFNILDFITFIFFYYF